MVYQTICLRLIIKTWGSVSSIIIANRSVTKKRLETTALRGQTLFFGFYIPRTTHDQPVGVVVTDIAIGAGGFVLDSQPGQIGYSAVNGSPLLSRIFEAVLPRQCAAEMGPTTRYTLRRNIASKLKIRFLGGNSLPVTFC